MIIKCILTLLLVTVYIAFEATMMEKRKIRQLEGFLLLLRHIRAQISCFSSPLSDIYSEFHNDALAQCGFLQKLASSDFAQALESSREKIYLKPEEINMLSALASSLGNSYRDEELQLCDYYIGEFETLFSGARDDHPRNLRLCRSLVITCGLMLIVVLI